MREFEKKAQFYGNIERFMVCCLKKMKYVVFSVKWITFMKEKLRRM